MIRITWSTDENHVYIINYDASSTIKSSTMKQSLMNTIEILWEKIEEQEAKYRNAIVCGENYDTLKSIRAGIFILKRELQRKEGSLLDEVTKRHNLG
jgi:hypothetical protein